ncbi:MAG: cell surface protein SprA [Flavobacteriales bacterium]|nr:cell surface protein SprA [Flavobacteriales bacterium]
MSHFKVLKYCILTAVIAVFFGIGEVHSHSIPEFKTMLDSPEIDLQFPIDDSYDPSQSGGGQIDFEDPLNIHNEVEYDPITQQYIFSSFIGDSLIYRYSSTMTMEEYFEYQNNQSLDSYWQNKMDEQSDAYRQTDNVIPKLNIPGARKLFGSDFVEIRPQGSAELSFGLNSSRTDNPVLPEKQRRITTFDFDQKIQMNLTGKIGDLMEIGFNYNTEATFDFENQLKLDYSGEEDDIIQKLEAGNVSMPLNSSLISGSQSLFGIKSELKFGRLTATTVLSQQKGQKKEIEVAGGAQVNDFEIYADNYEENRHFFLSYYFRDGYDNSMKTLPLVMSGVQIQRIEVWVTNRTNDFNETRNVIAFSDLGEINANVLENPAWYAGGANLPSNNNNLLYQSIQNNNNIRNYVNASNELSGPSFGMVQSVEYEKLENARLLSSNEFTYNSVLGFISLNQSLNNDEVLGVAYQYTYNGQTYQVGELSTDGVSGQNALYLKLLKSTVRNPRKKLWDLMMKNVYSLGAYQIDATNFRLDIWYNNPSTSVDINYIPKPGVDDKLLIQLVDLDRLNQQQATYSDGLFDFLPISDNQGRIANGGTINPRNGRLYFTTIEPFGSTIDKKLAAKGISQAIRNTVVFQQLYDSTKTAAQQLPELNRYKIKGVYQSSVSSEISLNALNIPQGSVVVTAGGQVLTEGSQYTVDYNLGRVKILDDGILSSGTPIKISLESNSLFSIQVKSLMGTHLDYKISKDANIGATAIRLTEKPLTQKVNIGDEPIANTMLGLDGGFRKEVPFLTKLVDKLPFIETKEKSVVNFSAEVATLIPGHNRAINVSGEDGTSYIDDFEGSQSSIDIRTFNTWVLSSVPQGQPDLFPEAGLYDNITYGKNRAKIAWYVIDPLFHNDINLTPSHIKGNEAMQWNHTMRQVLVNEVFPNKQLSTGQLQNIPVFDLAFYPKEKGPYNYDANFSSYSAGVNPSGELQNPASRWGGIMRTLTTNDFEAANIEFIQFWMMDPFSSSTTNSLGEPASNDDSPNSSGGFLYFNLGNISEDILRDGRKSFENGLPIDGDYSPDDWTSTDWGFIPTTQVIVNAFNNDLDSRIFQDVGLDGLGDADESTFFNDYISDIQGVVADPTALSNLLADPSSDNYNYFRDDDYDNEQRSIRERYKSYNNPDGNSPTSEMSANYNADGYATSASTLPNVEDINQDNNLNETESYFQYKVALKPQNMVVGSNYITDRILATDERSGKQVYWYQFRVPLREFSKRVNGIQDFRSIRFIRMFMQGWSEDVVLRFARLELIRGEWRSYLGSLLTDGEYLQPEESNTTFNISAVNIEDNGNREPIHYVLPDGIIRETNYQTANLAQQNEQSLVLDVCGLQDGDARAAYRNVNFDIRNYNKIQMFVHAESNDDLNPVFDDEATVFVRLGTDFISNYYEYEMPLKISPWNDHTSSSVWPDANNMVIDLNKLKAVKVNRNGIGLNVLERYTEKDPDDLTRNITVIGNPNLQGLKTIMIGIRNPKNDDPANQWQPDDGMEKCLEVWVNELRLSDFNENGGWAAIGRVNANLADFADVSLSGNYSTPGFGSIEKRVSERQQEFMYGMDASSTIRLGKFFGEKSGVRLPMFVGYSKNVIKPLYDPLSPDLIFEQDADEVVDDWKDRLKDGIDITERKSINFTNVRIDKQSGKNEKKPRFWNVSNFSVSYSFNEFYHRDINTRQDLQRNYLASVNYGFNNNPKPVEPFKKIKFIRKSKWLRPIRDINFFLSPKQVAIRSSINRTYNIFATRYNFPGGENFEIPQYSKTFNWDRDYDFKYDITKSLQVDIKAMNRAFINESPGQVDYGIFGYDRESASDSVQNSFSNFGETMSYNHIANVTFKWPFKSFPLTDWITLSTRYTGNFDWTRAPLALVNDTLNIGNIVQNSRAVIWNGKLNFTTLYNKVPYLKKVNKKYGGGRGRSRSRALNNAGGSKGDSKSKKGAEKDDEKGKGKDKGKKGKKGKGDKDDNQFNIVEHLARIIMSLKTVTGTFTTNDGIMLPGYANYTNVLGMDEQWGGPSWEFIAGGYQERDLIGQRTGMLFADHAYQNNWLVDTSNFGLISTQYVVNHTENMNFKASIKPINSLRIDITADRNFMENRNSNLGWDNDFDAFTLVNNQYTGSFSTSIITWGTAFAADKGSDSTLTNAIFDNLLAIRSEVSSLLGSQNPYSDTSASETGYAGGYGSSQQDVIIGAFLSAYQGVDPTLDNISPFSQKIPLPNWRITFDGLSKIKFLKKYIKTLSFSHAYRSNFTLSNYTTNLNGRFDPNGNATELDMAGNFISEKQIMSMSILEQFSPLLGMDLTLKNEIMVKLEMKKDRNISLSLSNNQITEIKGSEFVLGSGYTWRKLKLPFKFGGKPIEPSDLRLRLDVSVRDNKTITRKIIENQNQATAGQRMVSIKFSGDYNLSKQLMVRLYFDRIVNTPFVSTSFPTANTNAGFALRFQL